MRRTALPPCTAVAILDRFELRQFGSFCFRGWDDYPAFSCVNEAPDDGAQRTQPEQASRDGLNPKAGAALVGGLRIAGQVEDAADDPDQAQTAAIPSLM